MSAPAAKHTRNVHPMRPSNEQSLHSRESQRGSAEDRVVQHLFALVQKALKAQREHQPKEEESLLSRLWEGLKDLGSTALEWAPTLAPLLMAL